MRRLVPLALLAGYATDLALGDPRCGHPVAGFGRVAQAIERATHRPTRVAGLLHAALLVGGCAALGRGAERLAARHPWRLAAVLATAVWVALGGRSLATTSRRVGRLVEAGDLPAARHEVTALVSRDTGDLGPEQLCRAAVESVAENTSDAVVAPLFWGAVAGTGGVLGHRAANTLDAMVGYRSRRYARFGWASARLDDALNWPAARLGALLTVVLSPLVGGKPLRSWRILRRDGASHPSPNAGRLEAAFAGALGVSLGGENTYGERRERRPVLGEGPIPGPADVERAIRLSSAVGAASALLLALMAAVVEARTAGAPA